MDEKARTRVVIVEDDRDVAGLVSEILEAEGFATLTADQTTPADVVAAHRPRLLLLDVMLGRRDGRDVLAELQENGLRHVPVVLLSGRDELEREMRNIGAVAFLRKPFDIDDLVATCRSAAR
jgi:DNA-binding response OmpR family regulator